MITEGFIYFLQKSTEQFQSLRENSMQTKKSVASGYSSLFKNDFLRFDRLKSERFTWEHRTYSPLCSRICRLIHIDLFRIQIKSCNEALNTIGLYLRSRFVESLGNKNPVLHIGKVYLKVLVLWVHTYRVKVNRKWDNYQQRFFWLHQN